MQDKSRKPEIPDLQTQLEALLDEVWRREAEWRFDSRLELAVRSHARRRSAAGG